MDGKVKKYVSGLSSESTVQLSVKQLFLAIFLGGGLSIILGVVSSSLLLSVILPAFLVIIYAFATTKAKNSDLNNRFAIK